MKKLEGSASALIDERIKELGDWRGNTLAQVPQSYTRQVSTVENPAL